MPKNFLIVLVFLFSFGFIPFERTFAIEGPGFPKKRLGKLIGKHKISESGLSLVVRDLKNDDLIISYRPNEKMIPASVTKVLVAGAVLDNFEMGHKFETHLLRANGDKNLYIKGHGDPSFTSERMWYLVNEFTRVGIKTIEGDIVVDNYYFDDEMFHDGRMKKRVDRAYDAPVSGLSFNWNTINVFIRSDRDEKKPSVLLDPESAYSRVKNRTSFGGSSKKSVSVQRRVSREKDEIVVLGSFPKAAKEEVFYKSITQPAMWVGENLRFFLAQRGIVVKGKIRRGNTPKTATVLAKSPGASVSELVRMMMKFSNNFVAEMLVKQLSVKSGAKRGSVSSGLRTIKSHIDSLKLNPDDFEISSVSGLSRKNKFKNLELANVLTKYRKNFEFGPDFLASLPVSGQDGTLKRRMNDNVTYGKVRAKTGLLNNVSSLAGYFTDDNGNEYVFSFVYNGSKSVYQARTLFDSLIKELILWSNRKS